MAVQSDMRNVLAVIVVFTVGGILASSFLPGAVQDAESVNFTDSTLDSLWDILPLAMILGPIIVMLFLAIDKARA